MEDETFKCICGQSFDELEKLQAHWNDPDRPAGQHYRDTPLRGKRSSRSFPSVRKDEPQ
jgi:hypothetical protein